MGSRKMLRIADATSKTAASAATRRHMVFSPRSPLHAPAVNNCTWYLYEYMYEYPGTLITVKLWCTLYSSAKFLNWQLCKIYWYE